MRLIDTSICVAFLRGQSPHLLRSFRAAIPFGVGVSTITVAELYYGLARSQDPSREAAAIQVLLEVVDVIPFSEDAAKAFGAIRLELEQQGKVFGSFDLLIAAHAIAEDAILVTNHTREFSRIPTLALEDWLQ